MGERFEDNSDSRTHQDQRVEIHWTAEMRWTGPSGTPDTLKKRWAAITAFAGLWALLIAAARHCPDRFVCSFIVDRPLCRFV